MEPHLTLLHCPHNYWHELTCSNGVVKAMCRNKKCQASRQFNIDEWNAMGERALNKPVRV